MDNIDERKLGPMTQAIHCGKTAKNLGSVNTPIYASSTFSYETVEEGAKIFSGENPDGFVYGRLANPTVRDVEKRLALLENAEEAFLLASGMAAVSTAIFTILKNGDHVIVDNTLYGGTHSLITHKLPEYGIEITFVDATNSIEIENAIKPNTKLIYFETPTNPTLRVIPMKPIVMIAKKYNITTMVDSTFMTPILMKPLVMGIDVVIHSATKYLNGHSDVIAGVIAGNSDFVSEARLTAVHHGGILGPFEAYLLGRGLKTLKIRMDAHERNGLAMAKYLANHPLVKNLKYIGLENHPQHKIAKEQQRGFGSMMTFEIQGDLQTAKQFVNALHFATRAVSLGGVETLISHPASTTHAILSPEDREEAGVTDRLIRLSVGLEDLKDLIDDFEQAFAKVRAYQQIQV